MHRASCTYAIAQAQHEQRIACSSTHAACATGVHVVPCTHGCSAFGTWPLATSPCGRVVVRWHECPRPSLGLVCHPGTPAQADAALRAAACPRGGARAPCYMRSCVLAGVRAARDFRTYGLIPRSIRAGAGAHKRAPQAQNKGAEGHTPGGREAKTGGPRTQLWHIAAYGALCMHIYTPTCTTTCTHAHTVYPNGTL